MAETTPIRPGEEIDSIRLEKFLRSRLSIAVDSFELEQFPAGSSNLTYLIKFGTEEFVLRRPPFGNTVKTAHDMHREFEVLSKLSAVYPPAPKPILFCDDESVIGTEFYLMERRRGLIIRGSLPDRAEPPASAGGRRPVSKGIEATTTDPTITSRPGAYAGGSDGAAKQVCRSFIQ